MPDSRTGHAPADWCAWKTGRVRGSSGSTPLIRSRMVELGFAETRPPTPAWWPGQASACQGRVDRSACRSRENGTTGDSSNKRVRCSAGSLPGGPFEGQGAPREQRDVRQGGLHRRRLAQGAGPPAATYADAPCLRDELWARSPSPSLGPRRHLVPLACSAGECFPECVYSPVSATTSLPSSANGEGAIGCSGFQAACRWSASAKSSYLLIHLAR